MKPSPRKSPTSDLRRGPRSVRVRSRAFVSPGTWDPQKSASLCPALALFENQPKAGRGPHTQVWVDPDSRVCYMACQGKQTRSHLCMFVSGADGRGQRCEEANSSYIVDFQCPFVQSWAWTTQLIQAFPGCEPLVSDGF